MPPTHPSACRPPCRRIPAPQPYMSLQQQHAAAVRSAYRELLRLVASLPDAAQRSQQLAEARAAMRAGAGEAEPGRQQDLFKQLAARVSFLRVVTPRRPSQVSALGSGTFVLRGGELVEGSGAAAARCGIWEGRACCCRRRRHNSSSKPSSEALATPALLLPLIPSPLLFCSRSCCHLCQPCSPGLYSPMVACQGGRWQNQHGGGLAAAQLPTEAAALWAPAAALRPLLVLRLQMRRQQRV